MDCRCLLWVLFLLMGVLMAIIIVIPLHPLSVMVVIPPMHRPLAQSVRRCHSPLPASDPHPSAHLFAAAVIVIPPPVGSPLLPTPSSFSGRPALPLCYLLVSFCSFVLYSVLLVHVHILCYAVVVVICLSSSSLFPPQPIPRHRLLIVIIPLASDRSAPYLSAPQHILILRPACTIPMLFG